MSENPVQNGPGGRCELLSPTAMPNACGFLFNPLMMMQVNCRGYVTAQHMQPEPAKYSHPPLHEATGFMKPEQPYFAHYPGRFFYLKDEENGSLFSVPHEPVRRSAERFLFSVGLQDIRWEVDAGGLETRTSVSLPPDRALELWRFDVRNAGDRARALSLYPCFTVGYSSWMNRSAAWEPETGGIVARSVSGYQKLEEWEKVRNFKDLAFLLPDTPPTAWEAGQAAFEGEGGLHQPDAVQRETLAGGDALYETPAAVLQYRIVLEPGETRTFRFLFGPARDLAEIHEYRERYLVDGGFEQAAIGYAGYLAEGAERLQVETPDPDFDRFVNGWLGRQLFYHGSTQRLSTDPQTRNYLQDAMGMAYIRPGATREALLKTLEQQEANGALPEGVRLYPGAELKYINQVPHRDHCVWLPLCLQAYLDESGDYALLDEAVTDGHGSTQTVRERTARAMAYLLDNLDGRGLSLIAQGDWCDPLNMAGHEGRGVSGWQTIATVQALRSWAGTCGEAGDSEQARAMSERAAGIADTVQEWFWEGRWFARGITDDGRRFGTRQDDEGAIFLNPQSWALMAGIADPGQQASILREVGTRLETPWGVMMLDPPYTRMHEDIGRLTQKYPGTAENGSIYNHAAAFWAHALFLAGQPERGFETLRRMIPGPDAEDLLRRGQLPVFVPNYYRGAVRLNPRTAGRSSQLFNTGTAAWFYRIVIEQLFGLKGCREGLAIRPALPGHWDQARITRRFRGAVLNIDYRRGGNTQRVSVDGQVLDGDVINGIEAGQNYRVDVTLPEAPR